MPALLRFEFICLLMLLGTGCPTVGGGGGGGSDDDDDDATSDDDDATSDDDDATSDDDDAATPECTEHSDCSSDQICWKQNCENVLGRAFTIYADDATIETQGPDGAWDVGGGAPDAYLEIESATEYWTTSVAQDVFDPEWYESWTGTLEAGMTLRVWDDDLGEDDWIVGYSFDTADDLANFARGGSAFNLTSDYATVATGIEPAF